MIRVLATDVDHDLLNRAIEEHIADGADYNLITDHKLYTDENGFAWLAFFDDSYAEECMDDLIGSVEDVAAEGATNPSFRTYIFLMDDGSYALETNI